jgi:glycosyltransferase involved in cell wall biosynthesis
MMSFQQLHIIYLSFYAFPGRGTHTIQVMNMCSAFSKIPGIKITLLTPKQSDSRLENVKSDIWSFYGVEENFKIHFTPDRFNLRNKSQVIVKFYRLIFTFFASLFYMRKLKDDFIIYSRAPRVVRILSSVLRLCRVKNFKGFFLELHNLPGKKYSLKRSEGMIVISDTLKKDLLKKYSGIKEDKIIVAHDGANLNLNSGSESTVELRSKLNLPVDKKIITYTGRIIKGKGADRLIEAFGSFNARDDLFLLMVGKIYDECFIKLAADLKIKNILFKGFVQPSEVRDYLLCSDILVLPSTEELSYAKYTSPLKLFEYMAAKKPVVASSLESIKEVIHNDANGLIFDPSDVNSLINSLNYLLSNGEKAARLAERAYTDVKNYSWDKRAEIICKFILSNN